VTVSRATLPHAISFSGKSCLCYSLLAFGVIAPPISCVLNDSRFDYRFASIRIYLCRQAYSGMRGEPAMEDNKMTEESSNNFTRGISSKA
jgi:hypothetical protein